jgi:uncharacterized membrane protein YdbT with pleckstrin-like domain
MEPEILMSFKPSLRRAYFFAVVYVAFIAAMRMKLHLAVLHPMVLGSVGLLVVLLLFAHFTRFFTLYSLTPQDVEIRRGFIARKVLRVPLERITDATARQNILERILGIVNIYINTAGSADTEASFRRVLQPDAARFGALIRELKIKRSVEKQTPKAQAVGA